MKDYLAVAGLCIVGAAFILMLGTVISHSLFWIGALTVIFGFVLYIWLQTRT